MKYHYIGIFFNYEELHNKIKMIGNRLERRIINPHVTFMYKPDTVDESLFGEKVKIKIIAYGNNGDNEGFKVELFTSNKHLQKMVNNIPVPHITISISDTAKAVNTRCLNFVPLNNSIDIEGEFGGFIDGKVINNRENIQIIFKGRVDE